MSEPYKRRPREKLKPWQARFAFWWADQPHRPSQRDMLTMATAFANESRDQGLPPVTITAKQLRSARERDDYRGLLAEIERGGLDSARAKYLSHLDEYLDTRLWALREARSAKDWRAVQSLTEHSARVALPEKTSLQVEQRVITISLSPERLRSLNEELPIVTGEVLDAEPAVPSLPPATQAAPDAVPYDGFISFEEMLRRKRADNGLPEKSQLPKGSGLGDYLARRNAR